MLCLYLLTRVVYILLLKYTEYSYPYLLKYTRKNGLSVCKYLFIVSTFSTIRTMLHTLIYYSPLVCTLCSILNVMFCTCISSYIGGNKAHHKYVLCFGNRAILYLTLITDTWVAILLLDIGYPHT